MSSCDLRLAGSASEDLKLNETVVRPVCWDGDLERAVHRFVEQYNHARRHETLGNLAPADGCYGRRQSILSMKVTIESQTIPQRRETHFKSAD